MGPQTSIDTSPTSSQEFPNHTRHTRDTYIHNCNHDRWSVILMTEGEGGEEQASSSGCRFTHSPEAVSRMGDPKRRRTGDGNGAPDVD